jgi:hypothetical protein
MPLPQLEYRFVESATPLSGSGLRKPFLFVVTLEEC